MRTALIGLMAFASSLPLAAAHAATDAPLIYQVRRGDTLIDLAQKYMLRAGDYRILQRANHVRDPQALPIGMKLRIDRNLLKFAAAQARIVSVRGNVTIVRNGTDLVATNGLVLGEGATIRTSGASFATLALDDGSRISLPSNSDVRLSRLRKYALDAAIDYDFNVVNGAARTKVVPLTTPNSRYQIRTPKAVSAVRGTEFQSRVDATSGNDFAEVVEGSLAVGVADKPIQALPAGNGISVTASGDTMSEKLLPAPDFPAVGKMQTKPRLRFEVSAPAGTAMRVSLGADAGFIDSVAEQSTANGLAEFDGIEDGNYFVRLRAVSPTGFEGRPATYAFKRRLNSVSGQSGRTDAGYVFKWLGEGRGVRRYHFQLFRNGTDGTPMVDEAGMESQQITLSDLPAGDYYWRIASLQFADGEASESWSDFEKISISES